MAEGPAGLTRRQAYERRLRRRSLTTAGLSTLGVVSAIVILVPLAPGWDRVKTSFFNGEVFVRTFPDLLQAFLLDVAIFAWSAPLIAALGLAVALARDVRNPVLYPLRLFSAVYTDVFRGVPVVLVVYLVGFGIPGLGLPRPWNSPYGNANYNRDNSFRKPASKDHISDPSRKVSF